jgi:hypothetical protein
MDGIHQAEQQLKLYKVEWERMVHQYPGIHDEFERRFPGVGPTTMNEEHLREIVCSIKSLGYGFDPPPSASNPFLPDSLRNAHYVKTEHILSSRGCFRRCTLVFRPTHMYLSQALRYTLGFHTWEEKRVMYGNTDSVAICPFSGDADRVIFGHFSGKGKPTWFQFNYPTLLFPGYLNLSGFELVLSAATLTPMLQSVVAKVLANLVLEYYSDTLHYLCSPT